MSWEVLTARIAQALRAGPASESAILASLAMPTLPWELLRTALLRMQRDGQARRDGLLWYEPKVAAPAVMILKRCLKCTQTKPLDGFHRNVNQPDGRQLWCKACMCATVKKLYVRKKRRAARLQRKLQCEHRA